MPPTIDMRLDGTVEPVRAPGMPLSFKVMALATMVAVTLGFVAMAALALWIFSLVVPVALVAGLVAWGALWFRRWRARAAWRGGIVPR